MSVAEHITNSINSIQRHVRPVKLKDKILTVRRDSNPHTMFSTELTVDSTIRPRTILKHTVTPYQGNNPHTGIAGVF